MTNEINEIIAFLATKEMPAATAEGAVAENPEVFLKEIKKHLAEINQLFISSFQLQCLSSGTINSAPVLTALSNLQSRLRALVTPHANSQEENIKHIIDQINNLIPKRGQEGRYVYELTKLNLWNSTISQRISIPQGFAGVIDIAAILATDAISGTDLATPIDTEAKASAEREDPAARSTSIERNLRKFTFLATHGIGTCVGFLLYSKTAQRLALAHFDDPFNATRPRPDPEKLSAAQFHYQACITGILDQAQVGLSDKRPEDWKVILASSSMGESQKLCEILTKACTDSGIDGENITLSKWGGTGRSILINLRELNMMMLPTYEETVQIAEFPKESLTLRQALNLPTAELSLFRMVRGLILCNAEQSCYIENDYVTTSAPNLQLANSYFVATGSHKPIPAELVAEVDAAVIVAPKESAAAIASSTNPTLQASDTTFTAAASPAKASAHLPEHSGLSVAGIDTEHSLLAAANHGRGLEAATTLVAAIVSTLVPVSTDIHPAIYATAVAASAVVALTAASRELSSTVLASAPIEGTSTHSVAIAALAALVAAEKINFKPSSAGSIPRRSALGGRGTATGRHGFQGRGGREARAAQIGPTPEAAGGATKRPLSPSSAAPAAKFPRMATIRASDQETPISDKATARNPLENFTATNPAPVVKPASITPYVTTFLAATLANITIAKFMEATVAGEAEISAISKATLVLINELAAVARARTNPRTSVTASSLEPATAAASASTAIPQDPVDSAIQTIIGIPLPEPSDAGLIDKLTVYLAKTAAATLRSVQLTTPPAASAAVAKPFGFLRTQAGAAAAGIRHSPSAADSVAPAPRNDSEIKVEDNDDKPKPEQ